MALGRQQNWLGQQRVDAPHLRSIESGVAADFDLLAGEIIANSGPLVVKGFALLAAVGQPTSTIQVSVAGGILLHPQAAESGTVFKPAADRTLETLNAANTRVSGSFTAGSVNYVGVGLTRSADPTTADLVQILDADTDQEKPSEVPLARTLDYVLYISTQDFSTAPTVAPLAKVTTDANNNVSALEDARSFVFRLASGGTVPDPLAAYDWPAGRTEIGDNSDFNAADKAIGSLKSWMDAAMTRLWELGGGEHWYSPTADRNLVMMRTGASFAGGDWFEWDGADLHWQGLVFVFDNSTGYYNEVADQTIDSPGLTNLADGECVYVDLDRTQNLSGGSALVAVKAALTTLGTPTVPGSRQILAWRRGTNVFTHGATFPVGNPLAVATNAVTGIVRLTYAAGNPAIPLVAPQDANGRIHNTATASNQPGFEGTGHNNGAGVVGNSNGSGPGIKGNGLGTGAAVLGDASTATGGSAYGVRGFGGDTSPGGRFEGGANGGGGVYAVGGDASSGGAIGVDAHSGPNGIDRTTIAVRANVTDVGVAMTVRDELAGMISALEVYDAGAECLSRMDRFGYKQSRTSRLDAEWGFDSGGADICSDPRVIESTTGTSVAASVVAVSSTYPSRMLRITATAGVINDHDSWTTVGGLVHTGYTSLRFSAEWEASVAATGDQQATVFCGLSTEANPYSNTAKSIGFVIRNGDVDNTWKTLVQTSNVNRNVDACDFTYAAGQIVKFRMEVWGSATPSGAILVVLYAGTGASPTLQQAYTTSANIPQQAMSFYATTFVLATNSASNWQVGPVRMEWADVSSGL